MRKNATAWSAWFALNLMLAAPPAVQVHAASPPLAEFDFTQPAVAAQWVAQHDIASFKPTADGMEVTIAGNDPYFAGPVRDYPASTDLWLCLRLKSEQGGSGQIFYYRSGPTEEHSVRFQVAPGDWREVQLRLPALGPGYRFRIDPPGDSGKAVFAFLRVTAAVAIALPQWPKPVRPQLGAGSLAIESGALKLTHAPDALGGFELQVNGRRMALGQTRPQLGYLSGDQSRWLSLNEAANRQFNLRRAGDALVAEMSFTDADAGHWQITQRFTRSTVSDAIAVETSAQVDRDRSVLFLPLLTVLPGADAFGTNKNQGLFPGLEYLGNEPSSSEADLRGPAAQRLVPDTLKITFPLMAIQADNRYLGLIWEMQPHFSALFDSPDRTFGSDGHALAILFPGSDGVTRDDGHLLPHDGLRLAANQPLVLRATLVGGAGQSTIPAVQKYVELRGLPPLPPAMSLADYVAVTAGGWLDSKIREGNLFRHAVWQGFGPSAAADAAIYLDWLAAQTRDTDLAQRLSSTARGALAQVKPEGYYSAAVSHVRFPAAPLVYGHVAESVNHAKAVARGLLARFESDGRVLYRHSPNGQDYGKTHFAPDANGLTAQVVMSQLEAAVFAGDRALMDEGLKRLRALDKFSHDVPRGAQTWEVPLHTPDILASAHLVRAYTLGYELTGERPMLEQAIYWAWTGVPFVYLVNPTGRSVGLYATPPVFGATSWVAPVWIGLPVQWCGLVYGDALYRLARHDPRGPWRQLADGITIAGMQVTWPLSDQARQGLLPDSFQLREQHRDGPAINPGTVQACAVRWYTQQPLCDFRSVRELGLLIHAPGEISEPMTRAGQVQFTVNSWSKQPYRVLIHGSKTEPKIKINGQETDMAAPHQFAEGSLILQVQGKCAIELEW